MKKRILGTGLEVSTIGLGFSTFLVRWQQTFADKGVDGWLGFLDNAARIVNAY